MKNIKFLFLGLLAMVLIAIQACKDEDLNPIPEWETGVHGFGRFNAGAPTSFTFAEPTITPEIAYQWNSIDGENTVTKVEFLITFTESYTDSENNPRVANHGTKLFKTLEGGDLAGNREDMTFNISQDLVYDLFKDAQFDYDGDGTTTPVFSNPDKAERQPGQYFVKGDNFAVSWVMYTADGRKFDTWSDYVCGELVGASCDVKWSVVCTSDLAGEIDYVQNEMVKGAGGSGAAYPGEISGTVTWAQALDAAGKPIVGRYTTTDATFGHFPTVWQDNPVGVGTAGAEDVFIQDACNVLTILGNDQYGDTYKYQVLEINGATMKIRWQNTYSDAGTVTLTRKDGKSWPNLSGG